MIRQILSTILFAVLLISINACSNNDNPAEPQEPTSAINGNWRSGSWISTGGAVTDSLVVNLTLQEKDGTVSGTGSVGALFQDNSNSISVVMTDNVAGAFSNSSINIVLTSSISGDKYTFSGKWETVNTNFIGTVTITTSGKTHIYSDTSLFIVK